MSRNRPQQSFVDHLRHNELDEGTDGARQLPAAEIDEVGLATVDTTSIGKDDVFRSRGLLAGLASDGMAGSEPLTHLLAQYVTPDVLEAVAAEHSRGRALMIGTTDLDSGQAVTWNMGAIASSNAPGSLELFRKIMLASTSIPGVVSPVMIDVDVDGMRYQEMHVDGGVIAQVFTYPSRTLIEMKRVTGMPLGRQIHLYVIRNGKLRPE